MADLLINTTAEIKELVAINADFEFETLKPYLEQAQREQLTDVLGDAQIQKFTTAFGTSVASLAQIIKTSQLALANFALLKYMAIGNVHWSESGITITNNEHRAPAASWRIKDLRESLTLNGYNALEDLLIQLWANVAATELSTWRSSTNKVAFQSNLVNTSQALGQHYPIGRNFALYLKLKPTIKYVEQFYVFPTISEALYLELIAAVQLGAVTAAQQTIIDKLVPAVTLLSIFEGMSELRQELTTAGYQRKSTATSAGNENVELSNPSPAQLSGITASQAKQSGTAYLQAAGKYLQENAATYPTYESSTAYTDPEEPAKDINDLDEGETNRGIYAFY